MNQDNKKGEAARDSSRTGKASPDGMMGDGTEEQNLNQPGDPKARVTQDDVEAAFAASKTPPGERKPD